MILLGLIIHLRKQFFIDIFTLGTFFNPKENYTITESMGEHSYDEMLEQGRKFDYLLEPLGYNVSDYAYVIYDQNYSKSTGKIKNI